MACHLEGGTMKPGGAPGGVFQTADGWMSILAINDRDWKSLCDVMDMPALAHEDPRFATRHRGSPTTRRSTPSCGR